MLKTVYCNGCCDIYTTVHSDVLFSVCTTPSVIGVLQSLAEPRPLNSVALQITTMQHSRRVQTAVRRPLRFVTL